MVYKTKPMPISRQTKVLLLLTMLALPLAYLFLWKFVFMLEDIVWALWRMNGTRMQVVVEVNWNLIGLYGLLSIISGLIIGLLMAYVVQRP